MAKTVAQPEPEAERNSSEESEEPMPSLLICSLGNPGAAYATTLHSAGHVLVNALRLQLSQPTFAKDRMLGNGLVSAPSYGSEPDWTLWQSTAYMNESGKGVRAAYVQWVKTHNAPRGRLVVVHDELEKPLGSLTVKGNSQNLSARGHNGLKSCIASLRGVEDDWIRVGVGIGRPQSRESNDVAKYVLKKMSPVEKEKVESAAVELLERLRDLD